ncbi:4'-phosphopantetheinyl transferase family protein [Hyphomicrobium facile]|uniref:Enterobactin synthase component D n=1 Tax=Hyphomicrobium facile TaxID=51670 RepID=A0A1I7NFQ3_9HYPH|nr:4'-phosphopantetheinyl transferase superfamily protein [Hyphomicrobium facile]SFV33376.1 4'-phosphopantetheinyl transferase EntD (siderophore biosynthesis) [Hyphomicrobium facile]
MRLNSHPWPTSRRYGAKNLRLAPGVVWTNAVNYFAELLDPRIAIAEAPLTGEPPDLQAGEALVVARAVPRRRLEFAIGRNCARKAMTALGYADAALPRGHDRMPVWPVDLVGSITHTGGWAAAAVARRDQGFVAIGIDLEPADELAFDLWDSVCNSAERETLAAICGVTPGVAAHLIFCMKEAAFKCQYPLSGAMLEFADFAVDVDAQAGTFAATYKRAVPGFQMHDRLIGRFAIRDGYIASAVVVTSEPAS